MEPIQSWGSLNSFMIKKKFINCITHDTSTTQMCLAGTEWEQTHKARGFRGHVPPRKFYIFRGLELS